MSRKRRTHIGPTSRDRRWRGKTACGLKRESLQAPVITEASARKLDPFQLGEHPVCINCLTTLGMWDAAIANEYRTRDIVGRHYKPRNPKVPTQQTLPLVTEGVVKKRTKRKKNVVPQYDGETWLYFNFRRKWGSQIPKPFVRAFEASGANVGDLRFRRIVATSHGSMVGIEMKHIPTKIQLQATAEAKSIDNFINCFRLMTAHLRAKLPREYEVTETQRIQQQAQRDLEAQQQAKAAATYNTAAALEDAVRDLRGRLNRILDVVEDELGPRNVQLEMLDREVKRSTRRQHMEDLQKKRDELELGLLPFTRIRELWSDDDEEEYRKKFGR